MTEATSSKSLTKTFNLLVIECQSMLNWYEIFDEAPTLSDGSKIHVEQAEWDDISPISYEDSGCVVSLNQAKRPLPGTTQTQQRTIQVHFVLLRSVTHSIKGQDSRNKLFTLIHANIPSVNTLTSAYMCLERPTVFGALKEIEKKLGHQNFPLIEQNFYPSHKTLVITPSYPIICKVGHTHAGYGKMKFENAGDFADFRGLVAIHEDYVTAEPFIQWDFDMRIQKIGPHYRGFRRISSNWKGNVGNQSIVEDMEVTPRYKAMVDECAELFGGLEILGLDLLHSKKDGKDYILELNDTAIGLVHKHEKEDMHHMKDVVIAKMNKIFVKKSSEEKSSEEKSSDHAKISYEKLKEKLEVIESALERERRITTDLKTTIKEGQALAKKTSKNEIDTGDDVYKHPLVWGQSVVIIILMGILYSLFMGHRNSTSFMD